MTKEALNHERIDEWRWQVVQARDTQFNGAFFFGVRSTGIYCKPSCAARRPKREHVTFFSTPEQAEVAGFRACRRCRPDAEHAQDTTVEMIVRACEIIEASDGGEISLELLGRQLSVSPSHLQRTFKRTLGVSPKEFADAQRLENFKKQARQTDVTTAMYGSGFNSSRALYEKAANHLGMTPAIYRKGGRGMMIRFTISDTSLGKLLVAATERGVCAVAFGETEQALTANLTKEFPAAEITFDENHLRNYVRAIVEHLDGTRRTLELPLDLQATAFQLCVWAELRRIPYGETRSYKEVAARMGNANASRAVARACATNPVALLTPCHRVVQANGKPSGYRWGVERKTKLLAQEQKPR